MNEKIDMPLSEQVAKEASQKINKLDKELNENKDSFIFFLKDVLSDSKANVKFLKKIICFQFIGIIMLICGIIGIAIYCQNSTNKQYKESTKQFMDFINETDFYYEVELMNEYSDNNKNVMNVNK